jgi:tRNA A37 threonylcarbamoyltransferase TsaD
MCASFQASVLDVLIEKTKLAAASCPIEKWLPVI